MKTIIPFILLSAAVLVVTPSCKKDRTVWDPDRSEWVDMGTDVLWPADNLGAEKCLQRSTTPPW